MLWGLWGKFVDLVVLFFCCGCYGGYFCYGEDGEEEIEEGVKVDLDYVVGVVVDEVEDVDVEFCFLGLYEDYGEVEDGEEVEVVVELGGFIYVVYVGFVEGGVVVGDGGGEVIGNFVGFVVGGGFGVGYYDGWELGLFEVLVGGKYLLGWVGV